MTNYDQSELADTTTVTSIRDDLITCLYDDTECSAYDFESFKLNEYQTCYSFNSGRNSNGDSVDLRHVRRYGKSYGLHAELYLGEPDECVSPLSDRYGLVVFVHNADTAVWSDDSGVEVMSGYETDVALDRTQLIKMPAPFSDCIQDDQPPSDSDHLVLDTFRVTDTYTQQTCMQMCYQKFLVGLYGCFDSNLPYFNTTDILPCSKENSSVSNSIYSDKVKLYYIHD